MAVDPPFIDSSAGAPAYSGNDLRLGLILPLTAGAGTSLAARSGVRPSGSGTDLLVQAQSSPNMTVKVNPGAVVLQGSISSTQGPYGWALDTLTNLTIGASHATLDRTDLICVRVRDANVDTSGARDGSVVVVPGTNGGGVPSLPTDATYYTLAQVFVQHAVTSIVAGAITDKRGFTAALGGVIPVVSAAAETALGTVDGTGSYRTDLHAPRYYHAGVGATVSPGMVLIARQTLGVDAANITFSSIPADFTHLRIIGQVRSTTVATSDVLVCRFNGDTGNNYDFATTLWNDVATPGTASAGSGGLTSGLRIAPAIPAASATASFFGALTVDLPHYSDATTNRLKGAMCQSTSNSFVLTFGYGVWEPATPTAINQIVVYCNANLKAGSSLSLYGIS